jgi:hypothetical protein
MRRVFELPCTLFHATNNDRLVGEKRKYSNLSQKEKIQLGIAAGSASFVMTCFASFLIESIRPVKNDEGLYSDDEYNFKDMVLFASLGEEIIFRFLLQNAFSMALNNYPPSYPIITAHMLFAAMHLLNATKPSQRRQAVKQVACIALFPVQSILFYTTAGLAAPIAAHMTHNFLCVMSHKLGKLIEKNKFKETDEFQTAFIPNKIIRF